MWSEYYYRFFVNIFQIEPNNRCKCQKNTNKYLYSRPPSNNEDMITFNNFFELNWSCICVFDVWLIGFATVETTKTLSGNLSWISMDEESTWYNALYCVTLSLIRKYAIISMNKKETKIFPVALDDMLYMV